MTVSESFESRMRYYALQPDGEMTLEDVQATLEEEAVRLPEAGEGGAEELGLEGRKALLRAHLGVD